MPTAAPSPTARSLRALSGWVVVAGVMLLVLTPFGARADDEPAEGGGGQDVGAFQREELYAIQCGGCHGVDGRGGRTIEDLLAPPVRPDVNERMTVAYARLVMDTGRMPPAGDPSDNRIREVTLTPEQRRDILRFMIERFDLEGDVEEPPEGEVAEGLRVYAANCAACHGASGAGGVAGGGAWTPRVNDVTAQTLADAVRTGPFQMPRFDVEQITDAEIGDMAAFLTDVEEHGGTLLFPGELNPVFASGFGAGLAAVILLMLAVIAGKPTMFPDAEDAPEGAPEDAPTQEPEELG